ncbi:hypothetical protein LSAT2_006097, partial [Lamellibrachia satsuma]
MGSIAGRTADVSPPPMAAFAGASLYRPRRIRRLLANDCQSSQVSAASRHRNPGRESQTTVRLRFHYQRCHSMTAPRRATIPATDRSLTASLRR